MLELESVDPRVLGRRLADARKARGVTQEQTAKHLGCSRPTYIAIEKGTRPAKGDEIIGLAAYYGRTVNELVRPGEAVADLQPHLRAVAEKMRAGSDLNEAITELQRFADDYRELERIMDAPLSLNYPPEERLCSRSDVRTLAEDVAVRERRRLGLGDQPILELRRVLEVDVGLRIFHGDLPSSIAAMYAFVADLGCCILINRKHPAEWRRASMAHEYGHLIVDRFRPAIDPLGLPGRKPANERFAECFAMSFLAPATSVRRRFNDIVGTTGDFHVADLCRLGHYYFVSVEAMALRLEELGLVPGGTRDYLKESGFAVRRAAGMLELPSRQDTADSYSERYKYLAVHAFQQAKISEGQLARFLREDRVTAREIVEQCLTSRGVAEDGEPETLHLDFPRSLLTEPS